MAWHLSILTLYPELFPGTLGASVIGRAREHGLWDLNVYNIRDWATDKHQTVDDAPMGGGAGMVMRPDVLDRALQAVESQKPFDKLIYMSPRGRPLSQALAKDYLEFQHVGIICGRFEGIDQRVLDTRQIEEVSIGDYILAGGEVAAMVFAETCIRLLPNALNSGNSVLEESFSSGLLEYPHYTRPQNWAGCTVPDVLLSGHHEEIRKWRLQQAKDLTRLRRPDLWAAYVEKTKEG